MRDASRESTAPQPARARRACRPAEDEAVAPRIDLGPRAAAAEDRDECGTVNIQISRTATTTAKTSSGVARERPRREAAEPVHDDAELRPEQHEQHRAQHERQDVPERDRLRAAPARGRCRPSASRGRRRRRPSRGCRHVQLLGRDVREIRREEGDAGSRSRTSCTRRRTRSTTKATATPKATPPSESCDELQRRRRRPSSPALDRGERDRERDEADAVVDEALALEDRAQLRRRRRRADDRRRADRIGRAEHRAEHERAACAERRDERPADGADGEERRGGETEREQRGSRASSRAPRAARSGTRPRRAAAAGSRRRRRPAAAGSPGCRGRR